VTRVLSGAVLLIIAVAVVWWSPPPVFFAVAELLLLLGFIEYVTLARTSGLPVPVIPAGVAAMLTCGAFSRGLSAPIDIVLMSALVALGALTLTAWSGGSDALGLASASLFPSLYLGLPLGAMIAIRETRGREALFLLMLTIVVSDTAQYYSGRAFGRRPLAPVVSPKKTIEGAIGGLVAAALFMAIAGSRILVGEAPVPLAVLGMSMAAVGICGDLFESSLKRRAGLKDSSSLIPGHGGVLDRIDALLFATPLFYLFLRDLP